MAGQIQSSINNILGMAAVAKKLDPKEQAEAQRQAELENLDARETALKERNKAFVAAQKSRSYVDDKGNPLSKEMREKLRMSDIEEAKRQSEGRLDIAKRRFELSPSVETYDTYSRLSVANRNFNDFYNARVKAYDEKRQEQAMADMQSQAESMSAQKDKYKRHMDINAMYDKVKKGEMSQDEYESWFSALPNSQPDDDRDFDNAVGR